MCVCVCESVCVCNDWGVGAGVGGQLSACVCERYQTIS